MAIETIKINFGQIFEIEGKMYMAVPPRTALDNVNDHGQIIFLLSELND
jgi:hypothetical protein